MRLKAPRVNIHIKNKGKKVGKGRKHSEALGSVGGRVVEAKLLWSLAVMERQARGGGHCRVLQDRCERQSWW